MGWADSAFVASSESGQGVGDDKASWAYDGQRILSWHAGSRQYGRAWSAGDVIGCAAYIAGGRAVLSFSLNGDFNAPLGPCFVLAKVRGAGGCEREELVCDGDGWEFRLLVPQWQCPLPNCFRAFFVAATLPRPTTRRFRGA